MGTAEYGSLQMPEEVYMLIELEEELRKEGKTLDTIGLVPIVTKYAYSITPIDVIPFAHTGSDGTHFGFLTDFGEVVNLHEASIVCVSPTNDPPIRLVASNLQDFLRMIATVKHGVLLESIWPGNDEEQIDRIIEEWHSFGNQKNSQRMINRLREKFNLEPIEVAKCMRQAIEERNEKIVLPTYDGLGIVQINQENANKRYPFNPKRSQDEEELQKMRVFLSTTTEAEQLGFIRDAFYWYILSSDYDHQILNLIGDLLRNLKLRDEQDRLAYRDL